MALIYRSIFDVADPDGAFVDRAARYFEEWARLKLHDSSFELPLIGKIERPEEGVEISVARAEDDGLCVFRGALFETARGDGAELETQLIAISHNENAIAWVDLDRTALHATADTDWVPSAPNVVRRILVGEEVWRGPTPLAADEVFCTRRTAASLAEDVIDPDREVSLIFVVGIEGREAEARARARAFTLRLRGVASTVFVAADAYGDLSDHLAGFVGEEVLLRPGDVHVFLPGIAAGGYQRGRHRVMGFMELDGEDETYAALRLAPPILSRAVEAPPPQTWSERAKSLIESAGADEAVIRTRRLIAHGESAEVEFKSSLRHDAETGGANTELTKAVTKTLAAFLNCRGGTLLIGVADSGDVVGIENDLKTLGRKPNLDGFELCLREAVGSHLGNDVNPVIDLSFASVDGHTVAIASCAAHHKPVFHEDRGSVSLFVRAGNGTRPLDVREAVEFVSSRWAREAGSEHANA
jgi:hypothetical protein